MAGNNMTSTEYIQHHLQNMTFGLHPENGWSMAHSAADAKAISALATAEATSRTRFAKCCAEPYNSPSQLAMSRAISVSSSFMVSERDRERVGEEILRR